VTRRSVRAVMQSKFSAARASSSRCLDGRSTGRLPRGADGGVHSTVQHAHAKEGPGLLTSRALSDRSLPSRLVVAHRMIE
jgi:hypothetical protein